MITIPYDKISIVHHWCTKNISPREYYLHTKVGGNGWEISRTKVDWVLTTENPKHETYIELRFI